jgi:flagellar biosynthesis/type III secretory pathway protein FliH
MSSEDTNIEITRPYPLDAKAKRHVIEHFIHRYQEAVKQRKQSAWDELIQEGIAAAWQAIGEEAEYAKAVEEARQIEARTTELDAEITRIERVLEHQGIDRLSL